MAQLPGILGIALALVCSPCTRASPPVPLVTEGQAITGNGRLWNIASEPVLSASDHVYFFGDVGVFEAFSDRAILVADAQGSVRVLTRTGDPAPGGGEFAELRERLSINAADQILFVARLSGMPPESDTGLYRIDVTTGDITKIAREGDTDSQGTSLGEFRLAIPNSIYSELHGGDYSIRDDGLIRFTIWDGTSTQYIADGASITPLVQVGDAFESAAQGQDIPIVSSLLGEIQPNGASLLRVTFDSPANSEAGLFAFDGSAFSPVARTGEQAPGGGTFDSYSGGAMNAQGHVAFTWNVDDGSSLASMANTYLVADGSIVPIYAVGDPIAGTTRTAIRSQLLGFSDSGDALFYATELIQFPDDTSIESSYLAHTGEHGTRFFTGPPGATDGSLLYTQHNTDTSAVMNDHGEVIVVHRRTGSPETIYFAKPGEALAPLFHEGNTLSDGTVVNNLFAPISSGGPHASDAFNEAGSFAFGYVVEEGVTGIAILHTSGDPCTEADLAEPFGLLDLADITSFITAFVAGESDADLDNNGLYDLADITAFVAAFLNGCP